MPKETHPRKTFRIGAVTASVFEQETKHGTLYNVSVSRLYKENESDTQWQRSTTFGRDDLPALSELTRQAWLWIHETQQADREAARTERAKTETQ